MKKDLKDIDASVPSPLERVRVRLKICGMKYQENISEVAQLQPDYLGFIFYEKSSRFFDGVIPQLPETIKKVGVFVDASIDNIIDNLAKYNLQIVQLHGEESPKFCDNLKRQVERSRDLNKIEIIKVFSIDQHFDFSVLEPYEDVCDYYLFDTKGKLAGGNGYTFNWEALKNYPSTKPYFLSGGIGLNEIKNLKEFMQRPESQYCYVIDVNSKFEIEAGLKDVEKLKSFIQSLKQ